MKIWFPEFDWIIHLYFHTNIPSDQCTISLYSSYSSKHILFIETEFNWIENMFHGIKFIFHWINIESYSIELALYSLNKNCIPLNQHYFYFIESPRYFLESILYFIESIMQFIESKIYIPLEYNPWINILFYLIYIRLQSIKRCYIPLNQRYIAFSEQYIS